MPVTPSYWWGYSQSSQPWVSGLAAIAVETDADVADAMSPTSVSRSPQSSEYRQFGCIADKQSTGDWKGRCALELSTLTQVANQRYDCRALTASTMPAIASALGFAVGPMLMLSA